MNNRSKQQKKMAATNPSRLALDSILAPDSPRGRRKPRPRRRPDRSELAVPRSTLPPSVRPAEHDNPITETPQPSPNPQPSTGPKSIEAVLQSKTVARPHRGGQMQRTASYQDETRRPLVCLAFVLPLLLIYECGSILLGQPSLRSGIDQWFHQPFYHLGLGGIVILPMVTVAVLLTWHHRSHDHWKIKPGHLSGMLVEAVGLGLMLFWAANAIHHLMSDDLVNTSMLAMTQSVPQRWAGIVASIGSGIYEELIFRIALLTLLRLWIQRWFRSQQLATVLGVLAVSILFAALHYSMFNPAGSPFELSSFMFRAFASVVFCVLFLFRGFGIAVGTHVAYDVLTQL